MVASPVQGHLSPRLDGAGHQKSWAIPTQPHVPWCPLFKKGVAGKPGLFTLGRKLYSRYSSQGVDQDDTVQVIPHGGPVNSQVPLDCSQRHALAPGFLNRLPPLLLEERRLARGDGFGLAGCGCAVSDGPLIPLFLCP